jgi:manganese efflux pump family protein
MDFLSIVILSIGLAMDCFAVSVSKGICAKHFHFWLVLRMALLFGIFQAVMPLLGFLAGVSFTHQIESFDHWLAFSFLLLIGGKMIIEGLKAQDPDCSATVNPFRWVNLITLAFATSIDALATGIVFVSCPEMIWKAITIIGISSFTFTFLGIYIGIHFGRRFHLKVEVIGGVILIGIGLKILLEHLCS